MVSDFFYPNSGGVENHIYQLSTVLIKHGHKVVVVTHFYGDRKGIRYMKNGLKVYYLPLKPFYNLCILPTLYSTTFPLRNIITREKITILHGHSAFSALALESIIHANLLNVKTVFTEHSLCGFSDASSIITNQLLKITLCNCDHLICVSKISKHNTMLRAKVDFNSISIIPNAIDTSIFFPSKLNNDNSLINIIVMSRLVHRKGINLLVEIIPKICNKYLKVNFIIGGDGPKRLDLEEMREKHRLDSRVALLGIVEHDNVKNILSKGQIFLNTSLTEAFCIAILEAASCGLMVVSTKVGGIPEVLPDKFITLVDADVNSIVKGLSNSIDKILQGDIPSPHEIHEYIKSTYSWYDIACQTSQVYDKITQSPTKNLKDKLNRYYATGPICGKLFYLIILLDYLLICLAEYIYPKHNIDICPDLKISTDTSEIPTYHSYSK